MGLQKNLYLGNLNAKRDWGHARDYVEAQWLMLQQKLPQDFVIATGKQHSVREFINLAAEYLDMKIDWKGKDLNEIGLINNKEVIKIDPRYYRPAEVETLLGDATKAKNELNWAPKISFKGLVEEMTMEDFRNAKKEMVLVNQNSTDTNP